MKRISIFIIGSIFTCNLLYAAQYQHPYQCRYPSEIDDICFCDAIRTGNTATVRDSLNSKGDANIEEKYTDFGVIPLIEACWKGHEEIVKLLLQYDANVEARNDEGFTASDMAKKEGFCEIAELIENANLLKIKEPDGQ